MLPSPSYRLVLIILFGSFLFTWSCRREVEIPLPGIKIDGKPSAASLSGTATGPVGTNKMEFRVDLYVVDRNGNFVTGLKPGNLGIAATSPSSFTYALSKLEVLGGNAKAGGYSALLLLDQSGSIVSTDPLNLRIQAGKVFLDYMGGADQVALGSFTESSYYPLRLGHSAPRLLPKPGCHEANAGLPSRHRIGRNTPLLQLYRLWLRNTLPEMPKPATKQLLCLPTGKTRRDQGLSKVPLQVPRHRKFRC